ncbi:hypothetical protein GCM10022289_07860 [Pedobacter jeongneungensis]|uniref:Uncharacterized protein n=1 Tax=Pedobacter jeongneungensis TaxID=947309 RepID=A0ABP8B5K8_9SPHI
MKKYLLIALISICLSVAAQQTPTNKTRSNNDFSQVDNYLIGLKRLGIPTSETDNLDAGGLPQNTVKLIYNTTLGKLRVYNPLAGVWEDATDLNNYYTKAQIEAAVSNAYIKNQNQYNQGQDASMSISGGITANGSKHYLGAFNLEGGTEYADLFFNNKDANKFGRLIYNSAINSDHLLWTNDYGAGSYKQVLIDGDAISSTGDQSGLKGIKQWVNGNYSSTIDAGVFVSKLSDRQANVEPDGFKLIDFTGGKSVKIISNQNQVPGEIEIRLPKDGYSTLAIDENTIHKTGEEIKKGNLIISNELDTNAVAYLFARDENTFHGSKIGSDGSIILNTNVPTDLYSGIKITNTNTKGNSPINLIAGTNSGGINFTGENYYNGQNNQFQINNYSSASDATILLDLSSKGNSLRIDSAGVSIYRLEAKNSFASPLLAYEGKRLKTVKDSIRLSPNAINAFSVGDAASIKVAPLELGSIIGSRHEIGFSSWNTSGTQYGIGGRVTSIAGNEESDLYFYNNGVERLVIDSAGKTTIGNDIEVTDLTKGVILKSPNGSRFRITVSDTGTLTTTAL